ncbi:hypothetical protein [Deinococcus marmoris]|uniref:hypothetical protein n=1 Tax=Deinococcus marmoris TaxID=249408 RepID=UPI000494EEB9|nr:hypothetical protein [Deinococcus marmoris]
MKELSELITGMLGNKVSIGTLFKLAPVLAPVIADLADGDAELSRENRLKLMEVIEDIKEGKL